MNTHQNKGFLSFKTKVSALVESRMFQYFITFVIIVNAISIGLETYTFFKPYQNVFFILDCLFLAIFVIELSLKLFVQKLHFFKNNWNVFDFIIVVGSLVLYNTNFVSVLRIFRVLRVLRTITSVPSLRRIVNALFMAIPTISSVILLMTIIFYVYAVIGTMFFSNIAPEYFGNLQLSFITLFQTFTLESWASGIFRPIFAESGWSWLYFISFIVIATFIMINLIVGEIVNNAQKISQEIEDETGELKEDTKEIKELRAEIKELKALLTTYITQNEKKD
ncbi:ion transporter [Bacillus swezeyi]|uniref:ion transporter n=1 Tax=Bacillus swezeyi TaxID=1925020 RepID=UPI0027DBD884|nr:ion transporter [Bacillus swezeyi]MED1740173.1 ion transporter [Bacillus swezeyi]